MKDPELVERIAAAQPDRAAILRSFPSDVLPVSTPFYRTVRVVDLDVETSVGRIRYRYGLEGERVVALGEKPDAVYDLNDRESLSLGRDAVRAYVRFFFESVGDRKMRIVESAEEIPWRRRAPEDPRPATERPAVKAITVEASPKGGYRAVANATWDFMLVEVTLEITSQGRVHPASQRLLATSLEMLQA
jgi:hypothetical protein